MSNSDDSKSTSEPHETPTDKQPESPSPDSLVTESATKGNPIVQWIAGLASIAICIWVGSLLVAYYKDWSLAQTQGDTIPITISRSQFIVKFATIPTQEIVGAGVGIDGIPSLTDPDLVEASAADYMRRDNRVIGFTNNGEAVAFPIRLMAWHEVVNLTVGGQAVAVTYCPLCDSAVVFDRTPTGESAPIELGVSGLLYNNNVLMYDRADGEDSLWSQMMTKSVSGPMSDKELKVLPCEFTSWKSWKKRHPNTKILSLETGHKREYRVDPYLSYSETPDLNFGVNFESNALPRKQRVLGVWSGEESRCYTTESLGENNSITDTINGKSFTVLLDRDAGSLRIDKADEGVNSMYAYWFAWYAFYPTTSIYGEDELPEPIGGNKNRKNKKGRPNDKEEPADENPEALPHTESEQTEPNGEQTETNGEQTETNGEQTETNSEQTEPGSDSDGAIEPGVEDTTEDEPPAPEELNEENRDSAPSELE